MPSIKEHKIKAIVTLSDYDLDGKKYKTPMSKEYKSGIFRPTANINGYYTSATIDTEDDSPIAVNRPIMATVTLLSGDFVLAPGERYYLTRGYRRIGKLEVVEIL